MNADRAKAAAEAGPLPTRPWALLDYSTAHFPFARLLTRDVFKVHRLRLLHEYARKHRIAHGLPDRLTHKDNHAARRMMQALPDDSAFYRLYRHFMLRVLAPLVGSPLSYSSHPKMRVHFPGTGSVSSFHHDIVVTRRIDQVNFWMPFTDVAESAALWLESTYGSGDFAPRPVRYGQVLIFDGGYLGHGSMANTSPTTRISCDMRFSLRGATSRAEGVELMNRVVAAIADTDGQRDPPTSFSSDAQCQNNACSARP